MLFEKTKKAIQVNYGQRYSFNCSVNQLQEHLGVQVPIVGDTDFDDDPQIIQATVRLLDDDNGEYELWTSQKIDDLDRTVKWNVAAKPTNKALDLATQMIKSKSE